MRASGRNAEPTMRMSAGPVNASNDTAGAFSRLNSGGRAHARSSVGVGPTAW